MPLVPFADGRQFTDYRPRCDQMKDLERLSGVAPGSNQIAVNQYIMNNGNSIIQLQREQILLKSAQKQQPAQAKPSGCSV